MPTYKEIQFYLSNVNYLGFKVKLCTVMKCVIYCFDCNRVRCCTQTHTWAQFIYIKRHSITVVIDSCCDTWKPISIRFYLKKISWQATFKIKKTVKGTCICQYFYTLFNDFLKFLISSLFGIIVNAVSVILQWSIVSFS